MANTKVTKEDLLHSMTVNGPRSSKEIAYSLRVSYSTVKNRLALMRQEGLCHQRSIDGVHLWFLGLPTGEEVKPVIKKDLTITKGGRPGTLADIPKCTNWGGFI